ncbi:MAG: M23 family metallopeptidase, partial [Calditrichaeota bacterium]
MRRWILVLLWGSMLFGETWAQGYLWPTEASKLITSSFCEFRPRHFHAAIDIKTWNRTGYKVFAIDDGYVYRLRVAATGYGKAIYLKLKDGNFVVYGHLSGFIPELQAYADSVRLATRNNVLDVYPDPEQFPVKRGQVLGYTGETGIGMPHLHFEIRDPYHRPVNPLQFYREVVNDEIPPTPRFLAVIPVGALSLVNFSPDTLILPLPATPRVRLTTPVYLTGKAYLAVRAFDMADGATNHFDFYRAELFINDSLVYFCQYDRFSYAETHLIEIDKNFSLWRKRRGIYHNLYRHPANSLPFYDDLPRGAGLLSGASLQEGENRIRIRVLDFAGNSCQIELPVVYHRAVLLSVREVVASDSTWQVLVESPQPLRRLTVERLFSLQGKPVRVEIGDSLILADTTGGFVYALTIPRTGKTHSVSFRLQGVYGKDIPTLPLYFSPDSAAMDSAAVHRMKVRFFGHTVAVRTARPDTALSGDAAPLLTYPFRPDEVYLAFPLQLQSGQALSPGTNHHPLSRLVAEWTPIIPSRSNTVYSPDRRLRLRFPGDAAYDTLFVRIHQMPPRDSLPAPYRFVGDVYNAQPFDQPLNYGAELEFHLPDSLRSHPG